MDKGKIILFSILLLLVTYSVAGLGANARTGSAAKADATLNRPWYVTVEVRLYRFWRPSAHAWEWLVRTTGVRNNGAGKSGSVQSIGGSGGKTSTGNADAQRIG